jgi:phosphinothricin acetyltransferase
MIIREAVVADAKAIQAIYAPYVEQTAVTFEYNVPSEEEFRRRMKRCGIGRQLHETLEQRLKAQGILNMNACISFVETEDEYLTQDSVHFHEQLGYKKVAHFHLCGKKFGRWYDMIWMEKMTGEHL